MDRCCKFVFFFVVAFGSWIFTYIIHSWGRWAIWRDSGNCCLFFFKKCWSALTPFIWAIYNDISRRLVTPNGGLVREVSPKIGKPFATQLAKGHPLSNCRGVAHEQREKAWLFRLRIYNKLPRFESFDSAPWNCVYGMSGATSCQGKCWPCGRLWSKGAIKGGQLIPSGSGFFGEEKSEVFLF